MKDLKDKKDHKGKKDKKDKDKNDDLLVTSGDDVLVGNKKPDKIKGGKGDDDISGEKGNDSLFGEEGADIIDAGSGKDTVFGGLGDDVISGGNGKDILHGEAGNDVLDGGNGKDLLVGSAGLHSVEVDGVSTSVTNEVDTLTGGSGRDTFVLGLVGENGAAGQALYTAGGDADHAIITDYSSKDVLQLAGLSSDYVVLDMTTAIDLESVPTGNAGLYKVVTNADSTTQNELVAVLQGTSAASVNLEAASYV